VLQSGSKPVIQSVSQAVSEAGLQQSFAALVQLPQFGSTFCPQSGSQPLSLAGLQQSSSVFKQSGRQSESSSSQYSQ